MTAATPTTVCVKDDGMDLNYGTARRLARIYIEVSPAAGNYTTELASYVPNLGAISGVTFNGDTTALIASIAGMPTYSTTTVTWPNPGPQFAEFVGYYT